MIKIARNIGGGGRGGKENVYPKIIFGWGFLFFFGYSFLFSFFLKGDSGAMIEASKTREMSKSTHQLLRGERWRH